MKGKFERSKTAETAISRAIKRLIAVILEVHLFLLIPGFVILGQNIPDPDFNPTISNPGYKQNGPKVLFDEAHYNYHTLDGKYKPFGTLITKDGYRVTPNKKKFSKELLAGYDLLVIANAAGAANDDTTTAEQMNRPAYTEEECDAVRDWVKAGGALLLITDHYPFGGASQSLAGRFGVEMSNGYANDQIYYDEKVTGLIFSRDNKLLADNVITNGRSKSERINRIATFTGQSLKAGSADSMPLLIFSKTAEESLGTDETKKISAAGRTQGLALKFGKGRVVVLGEAAMLTSQLSVSKTESTRWGGLNEPSIDNLQFALNIMHWLSGLLK